MESEVTNAPIADLSSFLYLMKKSNNYRQIPAQLLSQNKTHNVKR